MSRPAGRVLVLLARSPSDVDGYVWNLLEQFVVGGQANALDTAGIAATPPFAFRTQR